MTPFYNKPTRVPFLHLVTERFPGLQSAEIRQIVSTLADKRLRRIRMDLEDRANAIRVPTVVQGAQADILTLGVAS